MNARGLPPVHIGDGDDWGAVNRDELRAFVRAVLVEELAGQDGVLLRHILRLQAESAALER